MSKFIPIDQQLLNIGIIPVEPTLISIQEPVSVSNTDSASKKIINGIITLTPIILTLLDKDETNFKRGLSVMLNNVRKTHQVLVDSAISNDYKLTVADYVLFNRLSLEVNCQRLTSTVKISDQTLAQALNTVYEQDSIYAEYIDEELLDDEMSLQYISLAKLAKVIFIGILKQTDSVDDEVAAEILEYAVEEIDSHIQNTLTEHISIKEGHAVRSKLLELSSEVLDTIISKEIAKGLLIEDRINYIKRSFKIAMSLMTDVIEINFIKEVKK
ncbi:MAG: hypothetical protein ACJAXJ_001175 [Colwellia sp.]|jgi:hypothetical protein